MRLFSLSLPAPLLAGTALFSLSSLQTDSSPPAHIAAADVDCDGDVDGDDVLALLLELAGLGSTVCRPDPDDDGELTLADALYVRRVVAGIITPTPTNTATATATFTSTWTATHTATHTSTSTSTSTNTSTSTSTNTPTNTAAFTPTNTSTSTPTQTATNTATATATSVTTLVARNWSWYQEGAHVHVVGEVFNGLSTPVRFVEVEARFYSAGGALLAVDETFTDVSVLAAGTDSPFDLLLLKLLRASRQSSFRSSTGQSPLHH